MKSSKVLLFLASVIALLALACALFPEEGINLGFTRLRFPSLHKVLVKEDPVSLDQLLADEKALQDSVFNDSVDYYHRYLDSSDLRFFLPREDYFDPLFASLEGARRKGRTVRILHYGDSQLEMDRMSDRLRGYCHRTYGGGGPGMVPVLQTIHSRSLSQWANGALAIQSSYGGDSTTSYRANGNYGPMTRCLRLSGNASAGFRPTQHKELPESFRRFTHVRLLFNNRPGPLRAELNGEAQSHSQEGVALLEWRLDSMPAQLRLSLGGTADIYGVMLDDGPGVQVDNIAMRGCSGQQFSQINFSQLQAAYSLMDVGLIILQFGGNSVPYIHNAQAGATYCQSMGRQVELLRRACPKATLLFLGPSDMSSSATGESYAYLPQLINQLKDTMLAHDVAYWSIFHAMGGKNSMRVWNQNGLAGSDFIHFSQKGADLMGDRLVEAIERQREYYHFRQRHAEEAKIGNQ